MKTVKPSTSLRANAESVEAERPSTSPLDFAPRLRPSTSPLDFARDSLRSLGTSPECLDFARHGSPSFSLGILRGILNEVKERYGELVEPFIEGRSRTIKFFTLGCKVNQYDTQVIREQFLHSGFREIEGRLPADVYIINTCTVTHRADSDSLNRIRRAKRENPQARIIVTGCLTELDEDRIKNIGGLSLIIKNKDKYRIVGLLNKRNEPNEPNEQGQINISNFYGHTRVFLKIQDGCINFCSYCKVPLVRGEVHSRGLSEIAQEAVGLVKNGYKEIVLCGVCLGAYGNDLDANIDLVDVLEELEKLDGLLRIRLSSIEAWDITDRLIDKLAYSKKICPYLHIPIQSGDDAILKKMNRKMTCKLYLDIINKLKRAMSNIAITTDVIVGFPGEKEENFKNTLNLIRKIEPLKVHIFPYSTRSGTAAFYFQEKVPFNKMNERLTLLKELAQNCSFRYRARFLNQSLRVLIEDRFGEDGYLLGFSDNYIKVLVRGDPCLKNSLVSVKFKEIKEDFVLAEYPG